MGKASIDLSAGLFFHWHRYFLWQYEKSLREECGYKGAQPYWDWTIGWGDPTKMSVFDGTPLSMGNNGQKVPLSIINVTAFGLIVPVAPEQGGGCVTSGPFAKHNITLEPVAFDPAGPVTTPPGLGYNPRCLTRDLHAVWTTYLRPSEIVRVINKCNNYKSTDNLGYIKSTNDLHCLDADAEGGTGFHTAGHLGIGGIAMDPWVSPQDPAFYLHHAMVDRIWSLWQSIHPSTRLTQTYGTTTAFNNPPSANVTMGTKMEFGPLGGEVSIGDVVSTVAGGFCYAYV